jgi:hypothetical protein
MDGTEVKEPTRKTRREVTPAGSFDEREWASLDKVEISRNSKGETQFEVAIHRVDADEAYEKACAIYDRLRERYAPKVEPV